MIHYDAHGQPTAEWLAEMRQMESELDPFSAPAPKGTSPYWLRPRDETAEAKHMRLIRQREIAHAARD